MRKLFFCFVVALCCTASAWAADPAHGDVIADNAFPYTRHLTNFHFNKQTQQLTFTDNFKSGTTLVRDYYITAAQRIDDFSEIFVGGPWSPSKNAFVAESFLYGNSTKMKGFWPSQAKQFTVGGINTTDASLNGGVFNVPAKYMRSLIEQCVAAGFTKVRIFVNPVWRSGGNEFSYYYEENQTSSLKNKWYANFFDIDLPTVTAHAQNASVTVDYGNNLVLNAKVFGAGEVFYIWQKNSSLNGNDYTDLDWSNLSSTQAKAGAGLQYNFTFNKNSMRPCNYRLIARLNSTGETDTCVFTVNFRYPVTFPGGAQQYYKAGDEVIFGKGTVCTSYKVSGRFSPAVDESNKSYIKFTMMPCPLTVSETVASFWVEFFDIDGKELKAEKVECGNDATPPTPPTVPGMEFVRWSGDYTNVRGALKLKAIYAISGEALELVIKEHKTYVNDNWKFNSLSQDYFKGSSTKALSNDSIALNITIKSNSSANAWLCVGRKTVGNDEIAWNDGGYQQSVSSSEAAVGKRLEWTLPVAHSTWSCANNACPKSNEQWNIVQEAYRIKVTSGGNTVYSNPIVFDVYYPLTIQSERELYVSNSDFWFADSQCMIPARAGEKLYIQDNESSVSTCALSLTLTEQSRISGDTGQDENGTWFLPYGQTDEMTVAPASYSVIFKAINPATHATMFTTTVHVSCGDAAQVPGVEAVEGYAFMGWESDDSGSYPDNAYMQVTEEPNGFPMQFNAKWEKVIPNYTVTWLDKEGVLLKEETVKEGEAATPPDAPTVDGYTFKEWDNDYSIITSDITIQAVYSQNDVYWTVTFKNQDGTVELGTEQVKDGCDAVADVAIPAIDNYTFIGWTEDITNVHTDLTVMAVYEWTKYTISFVDWDGTLLKEEEVLATFSPSAPADPTRESTADKQYKFNGWEPAIVDAVADAVYTAQYKEEPREFTVQFAVYNDNMFAIGSIQYGASAAWLVKDKDIPAPDGYYFKEWDKDFDNIIVDLVINAVYEKGTPTAVESIEEPAVTDVAKKVIINGNLYILLPDGKVYNVTGAKVK